ncbi:hypothetical protein ACQKLP_19075 [Chitinophaga sp. NPDC101104]|uniref:hypothetical protein n=1 Tax=Chitinophaga sp. NPDC101104 TaxID=3390561 RepID=UPI003D03A665
MDTFCETAVLTATNASVLKFPAGAAAGTDLETGAFPGMDLAFAPFLGLALADAAFLLFAMAYRIENVKLNGIQAGKNGYAVELDLGQTIQLIPYQYDSFMLSTHYNVMQ